MAFTLADRPFHLQSLAYFVRTHEKALANALQIKRPPLRNSLSTISVAGDRSAAPSTINNYVPTAASSTSGALAAALSLGTFGFASQNIKPAKLTLSPNQLYYLLSRFEELALPVGPTTIRLENIHTNTSPANYVSFLGQAQRPKSRSDKDSIHSVSSMGSIVSGMSSMWSSIGLGSSSSAAKTEKAKAQIQADLKYLYSAFTKVPCLKLCWDHKARLIKNFVEFPFDTAVPLLAFKNISALEIVDVDFRQFFGWDQLSDQLRTLVVKRASLEDPVDLLVNVVLDDMDKRRRRSSRAQSTPLHTMQPPSPIIKRNQDSIPNSAPGSPNAEAITDQSSSLQAINSMGISPDSPRMQCRPRPRSMSPRRPGSSRQGSYQRQSRHGGHRVKRSGSGSSNSSGRSIPPYRSGSSSNILLARILPESKWRFLRHLSLADNSLTSLSSSSLAPLADSLHSLDLSANHFSEIPDCLATLTSLRALNLSNCMIDSLHSLSRNPLPAITVLNLRNNRLISIAGVERLLSLERLDLRDNKMADPTELARLTAMPEIHEVWVANNSFIRTHGNYRVTIFNLFRTTPGHREDIVIDSVGPTYSERRQLLDRVPEPPGVPVIKPSHDLDIEPIEKADSHTATAAINGRVAEELGKARPSPVATYSESVVGSTRRRKAPRRRFVELSEEMSSAFADVRPPTPTTPAAPLADGLLTDVVNASPQPVTPPATSPRINSTFAIASLQSALDLAPAKTAPLVDVHGLGFGGDAYRRKIETLKSEVGNGWLSVLNEEGWDSRRNALLSRQHVDLGHNGKIRPGLTGPRAASQSVVSGSRILG